MIHKTSTKRYNKLILDYFEIFWKSYHDQIRMLRLHKSKAKLEWSLLNQEQRHKACKYDFIKLYRSRRLSAYEYLNEIKKY
jgi:hypothetical protein